MNTAATRPANRETDLHQRLSAAHAAGFATPPPAQWADPRIVQITQFAPAAVLIAVTERPYTDKNGPGVLFIERPDTMRTHAGQVAFPGGRQEAGEDAITAALREAAEEMGIATGAVRVIGHGDLYRTGTGFEITPVLATIPPDLPVKPDAREVAGWFEAPLAHVLDPARHRVCEIEFGGAMRRFIEIDWQGKRIWGVTAAILANLSARLAAGGWDG